MSTYQIFYTRSFTRGGYVRWPTHLPDKSIPSALPIESIEEPPSAAGTAPTPVRRYCDRYRCGIRMRDGRQRNDGTAVSRPIPRSPRSAPARCGRFQTLALPLHEADALRHSPRQPGRISRPYRPGADLTESPPALRDRTRRAAGDCPAAMHRRHSHRRPRRQDHRARPPPHPRTASPHPRSETPCPSSTPAATAASDGPLSTHAPAVATTTRSPPSPPSRPTDAQAPAEHLGRSDSSCSTAPTPATALPAQNHRPWLGHVSDINSGTT